MKLQWFVPGAAGSVVIGEPAASNVVYEAGVVLQIVNNLLAGFV